MKSYLLIFGLAAVACQTKSPSGEKAPAPAEDAAARRRVDNKPTFPAAELPKPRFVVGTHPDRRSEAFAVDLSVSARTWRPGKKPFDVEAELKKKLSYASIDVGHGGGVKVKVTYEEQKGAPYTPPRPNPAADSHTTTIRMTIAVQPKSGRPVQLVTSAGSGKTIAGADPYRAALDAFKAAPGFQHAAVAIGAASGDAFFRVELAKVLLREPRARPVAKQLGYQPKADAERAYAAIAAGKIAAARQLGEPATHPLAYYVTGRWGVAKKHSQVVAAVNAITAIGGDTASEELIDIVALSLIPTYQQKPAVSVAAMNGLAKVGSVFALPLLAVMSGHWDPALAKAASAAREAIVSRLPAAGGDAVAIQTRSRTKAPRAIDVEPLLAAALDKAGFERARDLSGARALVVARNAAVMVVDLRTHKIYGPLTPRAASVRRFARSSWYLTLIPFLRCSIGACKKPESLLPALHDAYNGRVAAELLQKARYQPPAVDDQAFLAAVLGQLEKVEKMGDQGVVALDKLLVKQSRGSPPDVALMVRATEKLVAMKAKLRAERIAVTASALGHRLRPGVQDPALEAAVIQILNAYAKLGTKRSIHRLSDLSRHQNQRVRAAALRARTAAAARPD